MKPRLLKILRLDDNAPTSRTQNPFLGMPLDSTQVILRWMDFIEHLRNRTCPEFDLLTIDFNFDGDKTTPTILSAYDDYVVGTDLRHDSVLKALAWPPSLRPIGKNTGILIGSMLAGMAIARDLPVGITTHTKNPELVGQDMASALLVTQILLASGRDIGGGDYLELLRAVNSEVKGGAADVKAAMPIAVAAFRESLLLRAGVRRLQRRRRGSISIFPDHASCLKLLELFAQMETVRAQHGGAYAEQRLDESLAETGLKCYDSRGALQNLDVRSVFVDLCHDDDGSLENSRLPLSSVLPAPPRTGGAGPVWEFVGSLADQAKANVEPVLDFFRRRRRSEDTPSVNELLGTEIQCLIALHFAWLEQYAERWCEGGPWDPFTDEIDVTLEYGSEREQLNALLQLLYKTFGLGLAASLTGRGTTITTALSERCGEGGHLLTGPLRYDAPSPARFHDQRVNALRRMLLSLEEEGCVEADVDAEDERYRLKRSALPPNRLLRIRKRDLALKLGFRSSDEKDNLQTPLKRIVQGVYKDADLGEYLRGLEERPLAMHFRILGWRFMHAFFPEIPEEAWPRCLTERSSSVDEIETLSGWRRRYEEQRRIESALERQIMEPLVDYAHSGCEVSVFRQPAEYSGGDYYAVLPAADGSTVVLLGDVRYKGHAAASVVKEIHGFIRAAPERASDSSALLAGLTDLLIHPSLDPHSETQFNPERFATFVACVVDPNRRVVTWSNAGHHPRPILVHGRDNCERLDSTGPPIGKSREDVFPSRSLPISSGDRIMLFSDGVLNEDAEPHLPDFSDDDLVALCCASPGASAHSIRDLTVTELRSRRNNVPWEDDATVVVLLVL